MLESVTNKLLNCSQSGIYLDSKLKALLPTLLLCPVLEIMKLQTTLVHF